MKYGNGSAVSERMTQELVKKVAQLQKNTAIIHATTNCWVAFDSR